MPKVKIPTRPPDDVPIWDALIAELGDPRPYEPTVTEFTTVTVIDEPCLDLDELDDAISALDRAVEDAEIATADLRSEGHATLDHVIDEFRERHQIPEPPPDPVLLEFQERTVVLPALGPTDDATVLAPALGTLDQLDTTRELPRWPS